MPTVRQVIKIKSIAMQTKGILQAVIFMIVVALVASCAASKEYSSKLFSPRNENVKDSQTTALRFLELDGLQSEKDGWVSTDFIMGRDTGNKTLALDKLTKVFPAASAVKYTATTSKEDLPAGQTGKTIPVTMDTKPIPAAEQPIAKNYDPTEVRNKKTREK
jgi:hypothetical protein